MNNKRAVLTISLGVLLMLSMFATSAKAAALRHIVILAIDGLHQADLTDPATARYLPNILALSRLGITYSNARTTSPSDEYPGALAILSGANPRSTGIFYDDAYARDLWPPGTTAEQIAAGMPPGTQLHIPLAEKDKTLLSGGGATSGPGAYGKSALDPSRMVIDAGGNVVKPWRLSKLDTIFDVASGAGMTSSFFGKHPAGDTLFEGPTGKAITDFYSPENDATTAIVGGLLVDPSTAPVGTPHGEDVDRLGPTTGNYKKTEAWDDLLSGAMRNIVDGKTALGDARQALPAIVWVSLQSVNVSQKLLANNTGIGGIDLVNGVEVVNPALASALRHSDHIVRSLVDRLQARGLYDSTEIIITATHGNAPRLNAARLVEGSFLAQTLITAGVPLAQVTEDDVALIWLADRSQARAAGDLLRSYARTHPEVQAILPGANFGRPGDNRTPDFVVQLMPGYGYFGCEGEKYPPGSENTVDCKGSAKAARSTRKRAAHGNVYEVDDTQVPLIVSGGGLRHWQRGVAVADPVFTTQIAPSVLAQLGLDWTLLDGVRLEGTAPLPNAVP